MSTSVVQYDSFISIAFLIVFGVVFCCWAFFVRHFGAVFHGVWSSPINKDTLGPQLLSNQILCQRPTWKDVSYCWCCDKTLHFIFFLFFAIIGQMKSIVAGWKWGEDRERGMTCNKCPTVGIKPGTLRLLGKRCKHSANKALQNCHFLCMKR